MKKLLMVGVMLALVLSLAAGAYAVDDVVPLSVSARIGYFLPSEGGIDNTWSGGLRLGYSIPKSAVIALTYDYIKPDVSGGGDVTLSTLEASWIQQVLTVKPVDKVVGNFYWGLGPTLFMVKGNGESKNKVGFHILGGYQTPLGWAVEAKYDNGKWSGADLGGIMISVNYKFM